MATTDPRHGYVRFYLSVLAQLGDVRAALERAAQDSRDAVAPFPEVLATGDDPDLRVLLDPTAVPPDTLTLWRPQDPALLTGLTDVYDVVGRFTFQGEDDVNLARLTAVVRGLQEGLERHRRALTALSRLPADATRHAEGLSQQELAAAEAARAERLAPFEPVAQQLRVQCARVLDAVRQVPRPDLADLDGAAAAYSEYVRRVQTLYAAGLPYLRRALAELCAVAQVEVPPSWPDALPFLPALPAELTAPPPADTPTVLQLRAQEAHCVAQREKGARQSDELALVLRSAETDKAAALEREAAVMADVRTAKDLVRWATKAEEIDALVQAAAGQAQQRQARVALLAQLEAQAEQLEAGARALEAEIAQRAQEASQTDEALQKQRARPPALFGRDEWRRGVEDLEHDLEERRARLSQRQNALAQATGDLATVRARAQGERAQVALLDRALEDARAREKALREELGKIEEQLGANQPAHRVAVPEADEYLARTWAQRNELRAAVEQAGVRSRQAHEERDRLALEDKQLAQELERLARALAQAGVDAEDAQSEALAQLAARRKSGFGQHVDQVLAPLEESLTQVDRIFVEPARQVLLQKSEGGAPPRAGSLRAQAEGLAHALAQLAPRVEPQLAAQAEALKRVQGEFCDRVLDAVRGAWA